MLRAHVTAVVDVLGPRYIAAHPETAAISWDGQPSKNLVGTLELVEGEYGQQVLALIETVAADYPVNSILLTELAYHVDGFGARDKTAYLAYANQTDWPRTATGAIDVDAPALGEWRSYEVSRFVEKAAARVHQHGKQLYLEVRASPSDLVSQSAAAGTRYDLMLRYVDRLVVWDTEGLEGDAPARLQALAAFFSAYGPNRAIPLLGLWRPADKASLLERAQQLPVAPTALQAGIQAVQQGGMASFWIAPSYLLTADHWAVLHSVWH